MNIYKTKLRKSFYNSSMWFEMQQGPKHVYYTYIPRYGDEHDYDNHVHLMQRREDNKFGFSVKKDGEHIKDGIINSSYLAEHFEKYYRESKQERARAKKKRDMTRQTQNNAAKALHAQVEKAETQGSGLLSLSGLYEGLVSPVSLVPGLSGLYEEIYDNTSPSTHGVSLVSSPHASPLSLMSQVFPVSSLLVDNKPQNQDLHLNNNNNMFAGGKRIKYKRHTSRNVKRISKRKTQKRNRK
jgi:hypothetical protein